MQEAEGGDQGEAGGRPGEGRRKAGGRPEEGWRLTR